jgi:hypothetical protein
MQSSYISFFLFIYSYPYICYYALFLDLVTLFVSFLLLSAGKLF